MLLTLAFLSISASLSLDDVLVGFNRMKDGVEEDGRRKRGVGGSRSSVREIALLGLF